MKNESFFFRQKASLFGWVCFIGLILNSQNLKAQSFCSTIGGVGAVGALNSGNFGNPTGPYYIRIYIHVLRKSDGTGGQTETAVESALDYLDEAFNPHNIFFVRQCEIIYIDNTTYFNQGAGAHCTLWQNYSHQDGIDIFFGSDEGPAGGIASNIGGKSLVVGGSFWISPFQPLVASHVFSHEMGHCLGLWHTHHGTVTESGFDCGIDLTDPNQCMELVNGSNSATCGDYVPEDTPADPFLNFNVNSSTCVWNGSGSDANGQPYNPDERNIMAYTHVSCFQYFSDNQGLRMRQIISTIPVLQACIVQPDLVAPTIFTNTTWTTANTPNNGNFLIESDLVIENGATLTISSGVTVHFGEQSRVIVKPNARLILYGTLTGMGCSQTWQGVQVWGSSPASSQYPVGGVYAQGRLTGQPGSVIENARTAAKLYGPTYTLAGGQINCNQTTFRNNIVGVEFAPYLNFWPFSGSQQGKPRNYFGTFSRCAFITDDDYLHDDAFYAFLHMTGVNGVNIFGSGFANTRTIDGDETVDWGYGIFANDAGFNVSALGIGPTYPPTSYITSDFFGLGYGIYAARIVTNRPYTVRQCNFNQCFTGIRNKSVSGGTILFNNFNIGQVPDIIASPQRQEGIIFETDISGFTCEENNFTKVNGQFGVLPIGTVSINTGIMNKTIRRNTFTGLTFGNLANDENASQLPADGIRGLYYDCNELTNTTSYDFRVPNGRIKARQGLEVPGPSGTVYNAAGNEFAYTAIDFSNFGAHIQYYYNPTGTNQEPVVFEGNITKISADANLCPVTYCEPPCRTDEELANLKSDYYIKRNAYQSLKTSYVQEPTENKANTLAYYQRVMDENTYIVALHAMYDTLGYNADTLLKWVGNMNSVEGDLWLADELLNKGDASAAIDLLDGATSKYGLTSEQEVDIAKYQSIISLLDGKQPYTLDETTLQSIDGFLEAEGWAEGWAKSISTLYGSHFPPEYVTTDVEERAMEQEVENANQNWLTVQPNPASDYVVFAFTFPKNIQSVSVSIFDANGKVVSNQENIAASDTYIWKSNGIPSGIYFYKVVENGTIHQSGKIILNK